MIHGIYILRNGSRNSFYPIKGGPWKKAMEIKIQNDGSTVLRYDGQTYVNNNEISKLRDLLIAE